jgi:hypothetical protein
MLQLEKTPESETRLENLDELINAAAEAQERGRASAIFWITRPRWLTSIPTTNRPGDADDAAQRQGAGVSAGVSERHGTGSFPHSRSKDSLKALEKSGGFVWDDARA